MLFVLLLCCDFGCQNATHSKRVPLFVRSCLIVGLRHQPRRTDVPERVHYACILYTSTNTHIVAAYSLHKPTVYRLALTRLPGVHDFMLSSNTFCAIHATDCVCHYSQSFKRYIRIQILFPSVRLMMCGIIAFVVILVQRRLTRWLYRKRFYGPHDLAHITWSIWQMVSIF